MSSVKEVSSKLVRVFLLRLDGGEMMLVFEVFLLGLDHGEEFSSDGESSRSVNSSLQYC